MNIRQAQLPKGWEVKKLGEIAKATYGYTEKASFEEIGPRFLRITDIQENGVDWESVPYCKISSSDIEKYKLISGDIVFARTGATTGKSYLINNPPNAVFASYLIKVHITKKELYPDFLYLFFQTKKYWDTINSGLTGSAQGGFNASKLSELEIPLPPLQEQQRIVAILDEAFTAIDKAKANTEQNLKNAKELFESELQRVFSEKGDGWEEKKLIDVCEELFAGGDVPKNNSSKFETNEYKIPIFSNGEKNKGLYGFTNFARVNKPSITISARGTIGYSEIRNEAFYPAIRLIVVTPKLDIIELKYLKYVIGGIDFTHSGSSIPQLTVPMIKEYLISYPSLKDQQTIVSKLDALREQTKKLEGVYEKKLQDLEELKKSVLSKAFSGEL